jgi:hypothetical protein
LEAWIERGALWDAEQLDILSQRLGEADSLGRDLAHTFAALRLRLGMGPLSSRLQRDVEAVLYPRLWKVLEAARDDLPTGEQRTRIQVLNRRLARLFVAENPPAPG